MRYLAAILWIVVLAGCAAAQQQQLLIIQRNWSDMPTFYRDCMEVKSDGAYRFDHVGVSPQNPQRQQVHAGKLSDAELTQLTGILGDPSLQAFATPALSSDSMTEATDIDTFWISIGRANRTQALFFDSSSSSGQKYSSGPKLPSAYETPAIKPLLNWYKQMTKRKDDIDKNAAASCTFQIHYQTTSPQPPSQ